jgi:hypothetical protein
MWANAAKSPRGAPKGSRNPVKDQILLTFYDEGVRGCLTKAALSRWPRRVGVVLNGARGQYGASRGLLSNLCAERRGLSIARSIRWPVTPAR